MKKSNIIVGLVVLAVLVGGAGWFALSSAPKASQSASVGSLSGASANDSGQTTSEGGEGDQVVSEGGYVASKNGTKYFPVSCGSAKTIKEENKIFFQSTSEAESAGYTPAKNC